MAWKKEVPSRDNMPYYFDTPVFFIGNLHERFLGPKAQRYACKPTWVTEYEGLLYMIPQQSNTIAGCWLGVKSADNGSSNKDEMVHFTGDYLTVKIDEIPEDWRDPCYEGRLILLDKADTYVTSITFYRLSSKGDETDESYTKLMSIEEIFKFARGWVDALSDFPKEDFRDVGVLLTKEDLIKHFERFTSRK